ncbi:MAG: hypothetical protein JJU00_02125 [Opitutales bacterium]|nr:hypothetical protein [Opitutales bacterium]
MSKTKKPRMRILPSFAERILARVAAVQRKRFRAKNPVPTIGVTGSVGKTTTSRMIAEILKVDYGTVALSTSQAAWLGDEVVRSGDCSRGDLAECMYFDPRTKAGVFELARGSLIDRGMILKSVDVGVVLNVRDNHVGQQGIQSREEMARLKSVVAQRALKMAVLNADDPLCLEMRDCVSAEQFCLVGTDSENRALICHKADGGPVALLEGGDCLSLYDNRTLIGSMRAAEIPASWGGRYKPVAINALYAMAATYGVGVDFSAIKQRLSRFQSSPETNIGRMNFIDDLPYSLWITWASGIDAQNALVDFFSHHEVSGRKFALLTYIGNRPDELIVATGKKFAASFTDFIVSDWVDLRGRAPGETPALLARGLLKGGIDAERITHCGSFVEGLEKAFSLASTDDLLVVNSYSGEEVWRRSRRYVVRNVASVVNEENFEPVQDAHLDLPVVDRYGIDRAEESVSILTALRYNLALRSRLDNWRRNRSIRLRRD